MRERERERENMGGVGGRGRERILSRLQAQSMEPDVGLDLKTLRAKIKSWPPNQLSHPDAPRRGNSWFIFMDGAD